jgi:ubiquitin C-terminal hydrolase
MAEQPDKYNYYDNLFSPRPFGLENTGAICWFNALLQALLSLPAMNRRVISHRGLLVKAGKVGTEYHKLVSASINYSSGGSTPAPDCARELCKAFTSHVRKNLNRTFGNSQECADEAFLALLDALGCTPIEHLFRSVYEITTECKLCKKSTSTIRDKNSRIMVFRGDLPRGVELDSVAFVEYLLCHPSVCDEYKCAECGKITENVVRRETLKMAREILVVVFDRFLEREDLRDVAPAAPRYIEFPPVPGSEPLRYKLCAKVEHYGTTAGGHYLAHVLRNAEWYAVNDTNVSVGSPESTSATFMLFYHLYK